MIGNKTKPREERGDYHIHYNNHWLPTYGVILLKVISRLQCTSSGRGPLAQWRRGTPPVGDRIKTTTPYPTFQLFCSLFRRLFLFLDQPARSTTSPDQSYMCHCGIHLNAFVHTNNPQFIFHDKISGWYRMDYHNEKPNIKSQQ